MAVDAFLNEVKIRSWHSDIISINLGYQSVLIRPGGSYSILFLVFVEFRSIVGFLLFLGGGGCGVGAGYMAGASPGFR